MDTECWILDIRNRRTGRWADRVMKIFTLKSKSTYQSINLSTLFSTIFVLIFTYSSASAQVTASARIDTNLIFIGDQVGVRLLLNSRTPVSNVKTDLTVFDSLTYIEILEQGEWLPTGGNPNVLEQRLLLTSFEAGQYSLPPFVIEFTRNGETESTKTGPLALEVATIEVTDSTQLNPIKPIVEEPRTLEDNLPYLIAIAAILLLIGLVFLIRRLTRKKEVPPPPPVILKPHEIALQKLQALKEEKLWQKGEIKEYQTELTFIIREYLENQFHVPALESTTDEIIASLKKKKLESDWLDRLRKLFQNADLVKFAKSEPPTEIHEQSMKEAVEFVWETKPQEEIKEQESKV